MPPDSTNDYPQISVEEFVKEAPAELELKVLAGEKGLADRRISSERIQKLGLALAGFAHYIRPNRVQIVGQSEISYLSQLNKKERVQALDHLDFESICCILMTRSLAPPAELAAIAAKKKVPILQTALVSSKTIGLVTNYLQEKLAPHITLHAVMLEIYGVGVLILGESGIGKSECALDLITRGHRLISDDVVLIKKIGNRLDGESPAFSHEHLEIRGLGIINIRDLFGVSAIGKRKKIELSIELKKWSEVENIERLGLEMAEETIFGIKIPKVVLPVSSGRNISTLVETAVRIDLLRRGGYNAARQLVEKHSKMVGGG